MTVRTRSRKGPVVSGTYQYWYRGAWQTMTRSVDSLIETVTDEVAPGNGHRFDVSRHSFKTVVPTVTGRNAALPAHQDAIMDNYPVGRISDLLYLAGHQIVSGVPSDANAATELVSKTNPSRAHVDVPVFAAELRELPDLLLKRSNDIGADIASGRLSAEFGWKPLLGDLQGLLNFKKAFDDRVKELVHLERSGIRRKRKLFSGSSLSNTLYSGAFEWSRACYIGGSITASTTVEVWGFCRWRPTKMPASLLGFQTNDIHHKAALAIAGVNPLILDASSIWELVPFSWLTDWCSNAGDYLAAHRNIVGATVSDIQIMKHTHTESVANVTDIAEGYTLSTQEHVKYNDTKYRRPVSTLSVEAHIPFLSERKVAILADVIRGANKRRR